MLTDRTELLNEVADYYSEKLARFGETPKGADWSGEESQILRFAQLSKIINESIRFSINDLGCGYGALFDYLISRQLDFSYTGVDVSKDMVRSAELRNQGISQARFINASEPDKVASYGVASGIFNVRLGRSDDEWFEYLQSTLDVLDKTSRDGFAFNCLTSYSDLDKKKSYLYYADPCKLFDLCKRRYSKQVSLLHDYGLYEFTILVRKM